MTMNRHIHSIYIQLVALFCAFIFSQSFSQAKLVSKNGKKVVEEIAKDLHSLLHSRMDAVKVSWQLAIYWELVLNLQSHGGLLCVYGFLCEL